MSETAFNLWRDPWLPVQLPTGPTRLSLAETLGRAHEIWALNETPAGEISTLRLLLALLQDVLHPQDPADLPRLLAAGRLPAAAIARFGDRHGQRFALFDPEAPFYQSGDIPRDPEDLKQDDRKHLKGACEPFPELPSGIATTWWTHRYAHEHALCPGCAASGLLQESAVGAVHGVGYSPSINAAPPIYVVGCGPTLFESLVRTLILPPYAPQGAGAAWWRRLAYVESQGVYISANLLAGLTFTPRRIRLYPTAGGCCTRCGTAAPVRVAQLFYDYGERYRGVEPWADPLCAFTVSRQGKRYAVRLTLDQPLWAAYPALFFGPDAAALARQTSTWLPEARFRVFGFVTAQAKWSAWETAECTVPLRQPAASQAALVSGFALAATVAQRLRWGDQKFLARSNQAGANTVASYWRTLAPHAAAWQADPAPGAWRAAVRSAAAAAWQTACAQSAVALPQRIQATNIVLGSITKLIQKEEV